jgi:hypothetical protein
MTLDDMALVTFQPSGPPAWVDRLAENAIMEFVASDQLAEGKANILALLKYAFPLWDTQNLAYRRDLGNRFFMESYRARLNGTSIHCSVIVHLNEEDEADSLLIDCHPVALALLFERLMELAAQ